MSSAIKHTFSLAAFAILVLAFSPARSAQSGVRTHMPALPDGATYLIEVPANWNITLFLYSQAL